MPDADWTIDDKAFDAGKAGGLFKVCFNGKFMLEPNAIIVFYQCLATLSIY